MQLKKNKTNKGQWAIAHCITIVFEQKDVNVVYDSVTSYKSRLFLKLQQHAGVKNMQEKILNIRKKIIDKFIQNIQFKESTFLILPGQMGGKMSLYMCFCEQKSSQICNAGHIQKSMNGHFHFFTSGV